MAKSKQKETFFRRIYEVSLNYYYPQKELEEVALREVTNVTIEGTTLLVQKIVNADRSYDAMRIEAEIKKEAVEIIYQKLPKTLWVDVTSWKLKVEIEKEREDENGRS